MKKLKLLLILPLLFAGCKDGPKVTVCVIESKDSVLVCSDPVGRVSVLTLEEAENYIALSPDDFKRVMDYMRLRCIKDEGL